MTGAISNAKITDALRKTHANFMLSAQMLKCSRKTVYDRVNKSPELQKVVEDEREGMVDIAEGALYSSLLDRDPWAVQFTLKTRGKDRGYVERQQTEITGAHGGPLEVTHDISPETASILKQLYREGKV